MIFRCGSRKSTQAALHKASQIFRVHLLGIVHMVTTVQISYFVLCLN